MYPHGILASFSKWPIGNALEFKSFADPAQLFAT